MATEPWMQGQPARAAEPEKPTGPGDAHKPRVTLVDGRKVCLGRIRPKQINDIGTYRSIVAPNGSTHLVPKLSGAFDATKVQVQPPARVDYSTHGESVVKRMYLNDQLGDCVIASKYHTIGLWSAEDTGTGREATDDEVRRAYTSICGPGDNGCMITDVLDAWQRQGLLVSGQRDKLDGYVSVDNGNKLLVQVALYLFGGMSLGINLPSDWTATNTDWIDPHGRFVGGHDVNAYGYDDFGVLCCTWGGKVRIKWSAFQRRDLVEECYAEIGASWWNEDDLAPCGISSATLREMLATVGQGRIPDAPNPPPPPPPPPPTGNQLVLTSALQPGTYQIGGGMPHAAGQAVDKLRSVDWQTVLELLIRLLQALLSDPK